VSIDAGSATLGVDTAHFVARLAARNAGGRIQFEGRPMAQRRTGTPMRPGPPRRLPANCHSFSVPSVWWGH